MNNNNDAIELEPIDESTKLTRKPSAKTALSSFGTIAKFLFTENSKLGQGISVEKTMEQEFFFQQQKVNTMCQAIFSLIIILSGVAAFEIEVLDPKKAFLGTQLFCLYMSFIASIGLWMTIIFEFFIENKLLFYNNDLAENIWAKQPKRIAEIIIILVVLVLHPNPVFEGISVDIYHTKYKASTKYSLNGFWSVLNLIKFYYITKYYLMTTNFYTTRTQRICEINNFDTSLFFSLKAHMVQKPMECYIVFFISIVAILTYALRYFERELIPLNGVNFDLYANCMWCLIITMTTVGYGDYYPSSDAGRLIGIIACVFGVFILSMFMLTISNQLTLTGNDANVYSIINRIEFIESKKDLAKKLITKYMRSMKDLRTVEGKGDKEEFRKEKHRDILISLHNFKEENMLINAALPQYGPLDSIVEKLIFLEESILEILEEIKKVAVVIDKICYSLNIFILDKTSE